jgi:Cdc6-like AAA superfamily ATPase
VDQAVTAGQTVAFPVGFGTLSSRTGRHILLSIVDTQPSGTIVVQNSTEIQLADESAEELSVESGTAPDSSAPAVTSEDIDELDSIAPKREAAGGDARVALGILRGAAQGAIQAGADAITDAHIETAVPHAKAEIKRKSVEKLTPDQRVLYDIISERSEIAPRDLYDAYREQAEDSKTERTVRNHLQKLEHYDLIEAVGEKRGRTYLAVS